MAKSFRAPESTETLQTKAACCPPEARAGRPANATLAARETERLHSDRKHRSADAIAIAVLLGLVVLAARNGATLWQLPHSNQPAKVRTETGAPPADKADEQRRLQAERQRLLVAQLRTDVGNIQGDVAESRWSVEVLKKAGPALDRLIAKAKAAGRPDLAVYWRALAEHLQCGLAAKGGNLGLAKAMLERAARHLRELGQGATLADNTLRGDVISTIGTFLGTAKALRIEAQSSPLAELSRLRHRLKVEDAAARQAAPKVN
jgi:hypothetical protein